MKINNWINEDNSDSDGININMKQSVGTNFLLNKKERMYERMKEKKPNVAFKITWNELKHDFYFKIRYPYGSILPIPLTVSKLQILNDKQTVQLWYSVT